MKTLYPDTIKLWVLYQEDGVVQSGLTDMTIDVRYSDGTAIITGQALTEEGTTGVYAYSWNATSVTLDKLIEAVYKKGLDIIEIEEYVFQVIEDQDGTAL